MKRISVNQIKKIRGFTLNEVLMTLAIAAIVLGIGIPSFQNIIQNSRKTSAINDLHTALSFARNTAITRKVFATVCKSSDGEDCATGNGSGDWSQGWIIFIDTNGNGTVNGGDEILRIHGAVKGSTSFVGNQNVINRATFKPQGMSSTIGTITYCDSRGATEASALVISLGGQVRAAVDTDIDDDSIVEGADINGDNVGDNVTC